MGGWNFNPIDAITAPVNTALNSIGINGGLGGIVNNLSGQSALNMSEEQFNKSLEWEKYKFNNAHQAAVADLKAAGLNPVLAASGGMQATAGSASPTAAASYAGGGGAMAQFLTSIFPAIAQMKQARAAETTANSLATKNLAEAGKINTEIAIMELEKILKNKDITNYETKMNYQNSKSPLWIYQQLEKLFDLGSQTTTAEKAFNFGTELSDLENSKTLKVLNFMNPQEQMKMIIKFLWKSLIGKLRPL